MADSFASVTVAWRQTYSSAVQVEGVGCGAVDAADSADVVFPDGQVTAATGAIGAGSSTQHLTPTQHLTSSR